MSDKVIEIGKILSAHGLKGGVKIFSDILSFENLAISQKIKRQNSTVIEFIEIKNTNKENIFIAKIKDINKIEQTDSIIGIKLFTEKINICKKNEFLVADLIDLDVCVEEGEELMKIGHILDIGNYGNGAMFEFKVNNISHLYPATFDFIKTINLESKYIILDMTKIKL